MRRGTSNTCTNEFGGRRAPRIGNPGNIGIPRDNIGMMNEFASRSVRASLSGSVAGSMGVWVLGGCAR